MSPRSAMAGGPGGTEAASATVGSVPSKRRRSRDELVSVPSGFSAPSTSSGRLQVPRGYESVEDGVSSPDPLAFSPVSAIPPAQSTAVTLVDALAAGPSRARAAASVPTDPETRNANYDVGTGAQGLVSTAVENPKSRKGKEKEKAVKAAPVQPERRVLPARIRRAAGGGAEGIRDLEEMVVDWLERWGQVSAHPPDALSIELTSIPYSLVDPPTFTSSNAQPSVPAVTVTPAKPGSNVPLPPSIRVGEAAMREKEVIETPSWKMVDAGEDDAEEAREEMLFAAAHPNKRLRGGLVQLEDTSDAYYAQIHRKYEVFERRQRIRERETLQFERYKMRSRIELLRGMSDPGWLTVVSAVLSRRDDEGRWAKGRARLAVEGMDWLRRRLVREGMEVIKRYDQLLPPGAPKSKAQTDGRPSTPSATSSLSPPPTLAPTPTSAAPAGPAPQRVAELRDDQPQSSLKRRGSTSSRNGAVPVDTPVRQLQRSGSLKRVKETPTRRVLNRSPAKPSPAKAVVKPSPGGPVRSPRVTRQSAAQGGEDEKVRLAHPQLPQAEADVRPLSVSTIGAESQSDVKPIHPFFKTAMTRPTPAPPTIAPKKAHTSASSSRAPPLSTPSAPPIASSSKATNPIPVAISKSVPSTPTPVQSTPSLPTSVTPSSSKPTPTGPARMPCLIAAAVRREYAMLGRPALPSSAGTSALNSPSKPVPSPRRVLAAFGVPLPGVVEFEAEFCINKLEEFFAVIKMREAERIVAVPPSLPEDEAMDVEGVEAVVL